MPDDGKKRRKTSEFSYMTSGSDERGSGSEKPKKTESSFLIFPDDLNQ